MRLEDRLHVSLPDEEIGKLHIERDFAAESIHDNSGYAARRDRYQAD